MSFGLFTLTLSASPSLDSSKAKPNGFVDVDVEDGSVPRPTEPTLPGNAEPGSGCNGCDGGSTGGSSGGNTTGGSIWEDKVIIQECLVVCEVEEHPDGGITVTYCPGEKVSCGEGDDPCLPLPCF